MAVERLVRLDDLDEGVPRRVDISGRAVLVVRVDGQVHALSDVCPHNGASLSGGIVRDGCVTCPSHLWRFSLAEGERQGRPEIRIPVFPVNVTDDGWVSADVPPAVPEPSLRDALLAHARTRSSE